jgi:hypothetical protein
VERIRLQSVSSAALCQLRNVTAVKDHAVSVPGVELPRCNRDVIIASIVSEMRPCSDILNIAFLGDHLPRQCGIATFTSDICDAIATEFSECQCVVGAVNDRIRLTNCRVISSPAIAAAAQNQFCQRRHDHCPAISIRRNILEWLSP